MTPSGVKEQSMAFWAAKRLQQARWIFGASARRSAASAILGRPQPWLVGGLVGIGLGIAILGASALSAERAALFVVALLAPFISMILGEVRRLFLALILLDIPFQMDMYLDYRSDVADLGSLGGWNISITTVSLIVLYSLWIGQLLSEQGSRMPPVFLPSRPLLIYFAFAAFSMLSSRDISLSFFGMFLLAQMLLLFVYIVGTVQTRQDVLFITTVLIGGLVLESLIMIGVRLTGHDFNFAGISTDVGPNYSAVGISSRIGGTFRSPILAAGYLGLLLAPAISLVLIQHGKWYKGLGIIAFGLGGLALIFTLSRGGWITLAVSMSLLCLFAWHRGWLSATVPLTLCFVVLLLGVIFQDAILTRLLGDDQGSAHSRIPLMKLAFSMIRDHPILGVGINNFAANIKSYATPAFGGAWLYTVHNKYLLIWSETGIGSLGAFVWFLLATVRRGWLCWKLNDRLISLLGLSFAVAIIGHMIHMFVDVFNSRPQIQLLWVIAGLINAMYNIYFWETR